MTKHKSSLRPNNSMNEKVTLYAWMKIIGDDVLGYHNLAGRDITGFLIRRNTNPEHSRNIESFLLSHACQKANALVVDFGEEDSDIFVVLSAYIQPAIFNLFSPLTKEQSIEWFGFAKRVKDSLINKGFGVR